MLKFQLTFNEGELLHRILSDHLAEVTRDMEKNQIEGLHELLGWEQALMQKMIAEIEKQIDVHAEMYGGYPE